MSVGPDHVHAKALPLGGLLQCWMAPALLGDGPLSPLTPVAKGLTCSEGPGPQVCLQSASQSLPLPALDCLTP
jgi:hypothetical protein